MSHWHPLQAEDVRRCLASDAGGRLSEAESGRGLVQYCSNEFRVDHHVSAWTILLVQFRNILVLNGHGWRPFSNRFHGESIRLFTATGLPLTSKGIIL